MQHITKIKLPVAPLVIALLCGIVTLWIYSTIQAVAAINAVPEQQSSLPLLQVNTAERIVNQQRAAHGLAPYRSDAELRASACAKADDMLKRGYWDHKSPNGVTPWSFITAAGYKYHHAGENLAKGYTDDVELVQAWMDSPAHRANVLGEYEDQGICERTGTLNGKTTTLVVQHLGSRHE
ncbi:CAP domain-containing protein [Rhodococcus qingshengii]|uniref:CAP domain-containing protein n=1 Tax=Rhodococcus qingshengii TaxID=334542 RepID=UPI002942D9E3|nr:CAP domain-containing protein [Rhodococcus qingshengii]WOI85968.1 CAP domain-containing protein [Rhodococcus qingshengii]